MAKVPHAEVAKAATVRATEPPKAQEARESVPDTLTGATALIAVKVPAPRPVHGHAAPRH